MPTVQDSLEDPLHHPRIPSLKDHRPEKAHQLLGLGELETRNHPVRKD